MVSMDFNFSGFFRDNSPEKEHLKKYLYNNRDTEDTVTKG